LANTIESESTHGGVDGLSRKCFTKRLSAARPLPSGTGQLVSYVRGQEGGAVERPLGEMAVGEKRYSCAGLGVERETTVDHTLIRGLITAFRVFVSGLSTV
jgi:hypothetical protein